MTGVDLQTENVAHIIQLALGPVFLLSGVGVTLSMLTQRLSRIVDRARTLEDRREVTTSEAKLKRIDKDLRVILRRSRYINSAIALSTVSALLTALVVTLLFASAFTPMSVGAVIAIMFVSSMLSLSTAFLMFLIEVRIATNTLRIGVEKHEK
jgi:CBS domain containing-hemolysin-like protein